MNGQLTNERTEIQKAYDFDYLINEKIYKNSSTSHGASNSVVTCDVWRMHRNNLALTSCESNSVNIAQF